MFAIVESILNKNLIFEISILTSIELEQFRDKKLFRCLNEPICKIADNQQTTKKNRKK